MTKTLSVSAIENGTVIDHITSDQTLRILNMLKLLKKKCTVTVGFNLPSNRMQVKDLIKIEDHVLSDDEANAITVLAPEATINIIKEFKVVKKHIATLPPTISDLFVCPNEACISNHENVTTFFKTEQMVKEVRLICRFCERTFERDDVGVRAA